MRPGGRAPRRCPRGRRSCRHRPRSTGRERSAPHGRRAPRAGAPTGAQPLGALAAGDEGRLRRERGDERREVARGVAVDADEHVARAVPRTSVVRPAASRPWPSTTRAVRRAVGMVAWHDRVEQAPVRRGAARRRRSPRPRPRSTSADCVDANGRPRGRTARGRARSAGERRRWVVAERGAAGARRRATQAIERALVRGVEPDRRARVAPAPSG